MEDMLLARRESSCLVAHRPSGLPLSAACLRGALELLAGVSDDPAELVYQERERDGPAQGVEGLHGSRDSGEGS